MMYFICLSVGACAGFIIGAIMAAGGRADATTDAHLANRRATDLDRANGILRRELAELRLAHEAPRDHGYGLPRG